MCQILISIENLPVVNLPIQGLITLLKKVRGVDTCFKNTNLLCDQHPTCDPGEDTGGIAQDEFGCLGEYKEKGLTPKDATQQCQSIHHNEESVKAKLSLGIVMIEAVPCDGIPTCWKRPDQTLAPDESFCDYKLLTFWVPGGRPDLNLNEWESMVKMLITPGDIFFQ